MVLEGTLHRLDTIVETLVSLPRIPPKGGFLVLTVRRLIQGLWITPYPGWIVFDTEILVSCRTLFDGFHSGFNPNESSL